jgi:hypothetical protein
MWFQRGLEIKTPLIKWFMVLCFFSISVSFGHAQEVKMLSDLTPEPNPQLSSAASNFTISDGILVYSQHKVNY